MAATTSISGIGQHKAEVLKQHGFSSVAAIAGASVEQIQAVPGFGVILATEVIEEAQRLFKEQAAAQKQIAKQKKKKAKKKKKGKKPSPASKKKKVVKEAKKKKKKGKKKK